MKPKYEDQKLKEIFKGLELESPSANFSARVMDRIFEEKAAIEQVKKEPVLGKGFWIIMGLFAGLFAAVFLVSGNAGATEGVFGFLKQVNTTEVSAGYQSFFEKLGTVPLSIAGILLASSFLLFLERFLNSRSHYFSS